MGHELLLGRGAVVLQGQDHWVVRRLEDKVKREGAAYGLMNPDPQVTTLSLIL